MSGKAMASPSVCGTDGRSTRNLAAASWDAFAWWPQPYTGSRTPDVSLDARGPPQLKLWVNLTSFRRRLWLKLLICVVCLIRFIYSLIDWLNNLFVCGGSVMNFENVLNFDSWKYCCYHKKKKKNWASRFVSRPDNSQTLWENCNLGCKISESAKAGPKDHLHEQ